MKKNNFDSDFFKKLKIVEDILILHSSFEQAVLRIQKNIEFSIHGAEPRHTLLVGESGTGKTWVAQYLASVYRQHGDTALQASSVLLVDTPPIPTLKGLAEAILLKLGDPLAQRGTAAEKRERAISLLKPCNIKLIVLDEFQHFLDHGMYSSVAAVADWLKRFIDDAKIPCLLMGLPRCEEILNTNEQLRRRFSSRLELPAFSIDTDEGELEFRAVLNEIDKSLPTGRLSNLAETECARRLHFACNGLLGYLRKLITAAFELMVASNAVAIDWGLLEKAFTEAIWRDGRHALNPFNSAFQIRRLDRIGEPFCAAALPTRATKRRTS